jgi:hypothetical protein
MTVLLFPYERIRGVPADQREHVIDCLVCGGRVDTRDLAAAFEHEEPCQASAFVDLRDMK